VTHEPDASVLVTLVVRCIHGIALVIGTTEELNMRRGFAIRGAERMDLLSDGVTVYPVTMFGLRWKLLVEIPVRFVERNELRESWKITASHFFTSGYKAL
jgi:hypothetical protein